MSVRAQVVAHQRERDDAIYTFHVAPDPAGLRCPLCRRWSPLDFTSPMGIRLVCGYRDCGVISVMPRVQLARAIKRR